MRNSPAGTWWGSSTGGVRQLDGVVKGNRLTRFGQEPALPSTIGSIGTPWSSGDAWTWSLACLKTGRAGRQLGKTIFEIRPQNGNHLCWHEAGVVPRMRNNTQLTPPSYCPPQGVAPFSYVLTVFKDALNTIIYAVQYSPSLFIYTLNGIISFIFWVISLGFQCITCVCLLTFSLMDH